jgi:hypothetical protein
MDMMSEVGREIEEGIKIVERELKNLGCGDHTTNPGIYIYFLASLALGLYEGVLVTTP